MSAAHFRAGDQILLAGGELFSGGIWLRGNSQGTANQPIIFRSYGNSRATIQSEESFGFYAHNTAGIELRQLNFVGSGRVCNRNSGVIFYLDSANTHLQHLRLDSLDVSGYQKSGISIGSSNGLSGYTDVRITNNQSHANGEAGISSYAFYPLQGHHNWYVGNCTVYDNSGRADVTNTNTGNGIVLSGIDGVVIEKCLAYHNGWLNANTSGGPVGIWGWNCNQLVIQQCESHHNQSGTALDGGGFDLDGGCTNSVLQYNYSHDNQGPGYLLAQFGGAPPMHDLTVRYNISQNDARQHNQGAIELYSSGANGGIVRANIYNNSVILSPPANGSLPKAVYVLSGGITDVTIRNNIFQTGPALPVVTTAITSGLRLEGNCYWTPNAALIIQWSSSTYNTLAAWRQATGQELLAAGTRATGMCTDPLLTVASTGTTGSDDRLAGYNLRPNSTLIGAGLNLLREFGISSGSRDFFGNPTPADGAPGNVGASEAQPTLLLSSAAIGSTRPTAWCQIYPTIVRDQLHVVSALPLTQPVTILLIDILGRTCQRWDRPVGQLRPDSPALLVQGLPNGHYILRVQSGTYLHNQSLLLANE